MRKTLVLAAAALTAGLLTASAQNVYSVNIVGYVNTVFKGGGAYTLVANPLDDGNGNQLTNLVNILPNKSSVQVWNGTGFIPSTKTSGVWSTNISLPPGIGFFVRNVGPDLTNTFVGSVVPSPATNPIPAAQYTLIGSPLPIGGTLNDSNTFNLVQVVPNKSTVQVWDQTLNAGAGGFIPSTKTAGSFGSNLTISVGQGFFLQSLTATNWVQTLPPSP